MQLLLMIDIISKWAVTRVGTEIAIPAEMDELLKFIVATFSSAVKMPSPKVP